jgi:predicted nucleic acid-binding protein
MILVDPSVIVAWLDPDHEHHGACEASLSHWAGEHELAISSVTFAELAAAGRTRDSLDEILAGFKCINLDLDAAYRAGQAFGQWHRGKEKKPVLADFLIRGQAAALGVRHLTNDRRRMRSFPEVEFLFP